MIFLARLTSITSHAGTVSEYCGRAHVCARCGCLCPVAFSFGVLTADYV